MRSRILIAGIGNIFFGDDAFGVEVARRLMDRPLPAGVRVVDFGIRGFDLTFALLEDAETVILLDATPRGEPPGTLTVLEPEPEAAGELSPVELWIDPHAMDPARVLRLVAALGGKTRRLLLVGCEPANLDMDESEPGLSAPVRTAVDEAVKLVESLVAKILAAKDGATPLWDNESPVTTRIS